MVWRDFRRGRGDALERAAICVAQVAAARQQRGIAVDLSAPRIDSLRTAFARLVTAEALRDALDLRGRLWRARHSEAIQHRRRRGDVTPLLGDWISAGRAHPARADLHRERRVLLRLNDELGIRLNRQLGIRY